MIDQRDKVAFFKTKRLPHVNRAFQLSVEICNDNISLFVDTFKLCPEWKTNAISRVRDNSREGLFQWNIVKFVSIYHPSGRPQSTVFISINIASAVFFDTNPLPSSDLNQREHPKKELDAKSLFLSCSISLRIDFHHNEASGPPTARSKPFGALLVMTALA